MRIEATELRVPAFGAEIAIRAWGDENQPTILALHGWLDNAASYDTLVPYLKDFRVCAVDFSGHGNSDHRPDRTRAHFVDYVSDVITIADALGLDEFILMGHSMGAGVASYIAGAFPERVKKLVLIEGLGSVTTPAEEAPQVLRESIQAGIRFSKKDNKSRLPVYREFTDAVTARMKGVGKISREAAEFLCQRGVKKVEGGFTWKTDPRLRLPSPVRFTEELIEVFLQNISAPVLVIYGEQGNIDTREKHKSRINMVKDIKVVVLPGGHHLHLVESSQAVAKEILGFLVD